MTDDELTDRWEAVLDRAVTHDEHLRIGYTLIRRHGRDEARRRLLVGTHANCEAMDAAERFDADLTARWSDHIASCVDADDGGGSFEAFIERHPNLRRSDLFRLPAWKGDSGTKRLFRTAAPYYARYRTAYPPELIALLARRVNLNRSARVLDLGCGPGSLAIPIAAYAGEVVAVDPEPEMIAELRRAAPENVTAIEARAEDVDEGWGRFELATAGRAFHWFDAPLVLGRLAAITPVVALAGDDGGSEAQTAALAIAAELVDEPPIERPKLRYAEILGSSPFSEVELISVEVERIWTPDELIGLAYSTSSASPERLGERRLEFEERVRRELEPSYHERVTVDVVVGRRPVG